MKAIMQQQGVILVTVLLFLLVLSLLSINSLENSRLAIKAENNLQQFEQAFRAAEATLQAVESLLLKTGQVKTVYSQHSNQFFAGQSLAWWLANANCAIKNAVKNCYVVEKLVTLACTQLITGHTKLKLGADYFRITVKAFSQQMSAPAILQSTLAIGTKEQVNCLSAIRFAKLGRQSWREISR